jgi:hypothetical protein
MNTSLHNRLALLRVATSAAIVTAVLLGAGCSSTTATEAEYVAPSAQALDRNATATIDLAENKPRISASLLAVAPPVMLEKIYNEQGEVVYQRSSANFAAPVAASRIVVAPGKYRVQLLAYSAGFTAPELAVEIDAKAGEHYSVSEAQHFKVEQTDVAALRAQTRG